MSAPGKPSEAARYVRKALIKAYEQDLGRPLDPRIRALLEMIEPAPPPQARRKPWWWPF